MYSINKGIGKGPEFKGLKGRWMYLMAGGLVLVIMLGFVIQLSGLNPYLGLAISAGKAGILIYFVRHYNQKFGEFGLSKLVAQRKRPKYMKAKTMICGICKISLMNSGDF